MEAPSLAGRWSRCRWDAIVCLKRRDETKGMEGFRAWNRLGSDTTGARWYCGGKWRRVRASARSCTKCVVFLCMDVVFDSLWQFAGFAGNK